MGQADYLRRGDYNAICDRCGFKFKFSQLRKEWDGLYVCTAHGCWEPRQPQDYLKGIADNMSVPISRPEAPNEFLQDEIVNETAIISLIFVRVLLKSLATSVSSLASIVGITYPKSAVQKVVNGFAINTTTLG
jgi:hypothetical protein